MSNLSYEERKKIQELLESGKNAYAISKIMGRTNSAIYREIEKGKNGGKYDANYAEMRTDARLKRRGRRSILEENSELATYIEKCINEECLSPERIVDLIRAGKTPFDNTIIKSVNTIYKGIDDGIIPTKQKSWYVFRWTHNYCISNHLSCTFVCYEI